LLRPAVKREAAVSDELVLADRSKRPEEGEDEEDDDEGIATGTGALLLFIIAAG